MKGPLAALAICASLLAGCGSEDFGAALSLKDKLDAMSSAQQKQFETLQEYDARTAPLTLRVPYSWLGEYDVESELLVLSFNKKDSTRRVAEGGIRLMLGEEDTWRLSNPLRDFLMGYKVEYFLEVSNAQFIQDMKGESISISRSDMKRDAGHLFWEVTYKPMLLRGKNVQVDSVWGGDEVTIPAKILKIRLVNTQGGKAEPSWERSVVVETSVDQDWSLSGFKRESSSKSRTESAGRAASPYSDEWRPVWEAKR